jgi:HAMP domain-containing protein
MTATLVERLRRLAGGARRVPEGSLDHTMLAAADRIQELEAELASCRECRSHVDCISRGEGPK